MWVYVVRLSVVLEITQIAGIEAKNQEKFFIILSLAFYTYSMSEQRFKNFDCINGGYYISGWISFIW